MPETVIAGRYRLHELLGRSGMSEVWRAEDLELGRDVAIKLLAPDADLARFEREARAVASLAHPNVMQLYDYGESEERPYMVLEYVPGGTLEDRLRDAEPLRDDEISQIAVAVASGLAHAHARGVVHRDLKPANVLFDEEGRPKIADFGIARLAAGAATQPGEPYPEPPPPRRRGPLVVAAIAVLALAGGALAYEVTRPSSSPAETGNFTATTLPTHSTQRQTATTASTSAPSTET